MPCTAEDLVALLDAMPPAVAGLPRRPPWTDAVASYAEMVGSVLPAAGAQLSWLVTRIGNGLAGIPPGNEPTHGDFHEGQLFVADGRVTGVLDIDTVGPGRRADDLACLLAHLSTVQRMSPEQAIGLTRLVNLGCRSSTPGSTRPSCGCGRPRVVISLATGPYRAQQPHWEAETAGMLNAAEALVRSAG